MIENSPHDHMDFEISFSDITMLESNGEFEEVQRIMNEPQTLIDKIKYGNPSSKWVVKSSVTVNHSLGFAAMMCDFYYDGNIIITDYRSSIKDIHSPDIRCLSYWAQHYGWQTPEPKPVLIESWMDFWKRQWETYIVNSEYLEKKYGIRKPFILGSDDDSDEFDDNDPLEEEIKKL